MRTPPPVLPPRPDSSAADHRSWIEHLGGDSARQGKALGYGVLVTGVTFGAGLILSLLGGVPWLALVLALMLVGLAHVPHCRR